MFHINPYIEWCIVNNSNVLNFNKRSQIVDNNIESYCAFIREHYSNSEYLTKVKHIEKWFISSPLIEENQNLRMTMFEM